MRARPLIACGVIVVACSTACSSTAEPAPTPTPDPAATTPPPETTDPPPAAPCASGSYRTAQNTCETFPSLTMTRSSAVLAPIRDHHATAVIEVGGAPYLYVFGGTDDWKVVHNDVQRARIHDDGTLDAFEKAGSLPEPRAGHCFAKIKDRYLLAGGIIQSDGKMGISATTILVKLGADGMVADVAKGPNIPQGVMHLSCEVNGDYVYALGGRATKSSTTMAARAHIDADGALGAFEAQTPLKPDRSHHASFVRENRIYILGGLTGDPTADYTDHDDAIFAEIGEGGKLGAWMPAGKLPTTLSVSSAKLYKDAVYVVGGLEGDDTFSDKIRRATFNADGTLGKFATLPGTLPEPRGHVHQTPMWKTFIFSVGGKDNAQRSLGTVDVGSFK